MQPFPIFLDLRGHRCLVVGGGAVGAARAAVLASAGAHVDVVDPSPDERLAGAGGIAIIDREFEPADCRGHLLVFACTDSPAVNAAVAAAAREHGVPCCRADDAGGSDFTTGAVLRRGQVCAAVSTGGASPLLAIEARDRIAAVIGDEFSEAAAMLGELRAGRRDLDITGDRRIEAMRSLVGPLLEALRDGRRADAEALVAGASREAVAAARGDACTR